MRQPNHAHRWSRVLLAVPMAAALAVGAAASAGAHDVLVSTTPADGASVAVVPHDVTLTFLQTALSLGTVVVVTGPGGEVQEGNAKVVDNTVTQAVEPGAPAGSYTVTWRVTSSDSHPVSGTFHFTAARPAPGTRPAGSEVASAGTATSTANGSAVPLVLAAATTLLIAAAAGLAIWARRRTRAGQPADSGH